MAPRFRTKGKGSERKVYPVSSMPKPKLPKGQFRIGSRVFGRIAPKERAQVAAQKAMLKQISPLGRLGDWADKLRHDINAYESQLKEMERGQATRAEQARLSAGAVAGLMKDIREKRVEKKAGKQIIDIMSYALTPRQKQEAIAEIENIKPKEPKTGVTFRKGAFPAPIVVSPKWGYPTKKEKQESEQRREKTLKNLGLDKTATPEEIDKAIDYKNFLDEAKEGVKVPVADSEKEFTKIPKKEYGKLLRDVKKLEEK